MTYIKALIVFAVIVVLVFGILFVPGWISKESPSSTSTGSTGFTSIKEHYGPPPGVQRAVSLEEVDNRGWTEFPYEYTANTASSISHMIERSA